MPDLIMSHDKHGVRAFLLCLVTPLCHCSKILTKSCLPHLSRCRIVHQFFVTRNCAACYRVDHWIRIMLKVDGHFGMFHECSRCVHRTERCFLLQGEQVNCMSRHNPLVGTAGNRTARYSGATMWLDSCWGCCWLAKPGRVGGYDRDGFNDCCLRAYSR